MPDAPTDLESIADELYAGSPATFVATRDALAKAARSAGDPELARAVKALRRPATAAWLVNLLAHSEHGLGQLSALADRLREAQGRLDGATMKELGRERNRVVADLTRRAVALATEADADYRGTPQVQDQVSATLGAAIANPAAEAAVRSGRLVSALAYAGLGEVDLTDAVATPLRSVPRPAPDPARPARTPDPPRTPPTRDKGGAVKEAPPEPAGKAAADTLQRANQALTAAEKRLAVAEEAYAQARSRRHHARLEMERLRLALEELAED